MNRQRARDRLGLLPARYSFVLNPYVRERFTKCPSCNATTRVRKLPLVIHLEYRDGPRLLLLNKTCRLCPKCETLIVHQIDLERVLVGTGLSSGDDAPRYVVLGTVDRATWRRGITSDAQLPEVREHMADFKRYLRVSVTPAHREQRNTSNASS